MKKLLKLAVLGVVLSTMLAGCIVVPARGGYYERPYHAYRY